MKCKKLIFPLPILLIMLLCFVSSSNAQDGSSSMTVILFRSPDSLTIYLPDRGHVNIGGLTIEVATARGANLSRQLETLPAFRGLPYSQLPTPICFNLMRAGSTNPLPLDCQAVTTLSLEVTDADIFWYDFAARNDRVLIVFLGETAQICASGTPLCELSFPALPLATATPPPIATGMDARLSPSPTSTDIMATVTATSILLLTPTGMGLPCTTQIMQSDAVALNVVRARPSRTAPLVRPVTPREVVIVAEVATELNQQWYRISYNEQRSSGWILGSYLVHENDCPD